VSHNTANKFHAVFRVGYTFDDTITINNSTFSYNSGGGIYVQGLTVIMRDSTVMFNTATDSAGIALQYQAQFTLSGMTIANNSATNSLGGGISINSGGGTISDTTFYGNTALQKLSLASQISGIFLSFFFFSFFLSPRSFSLFLSLFLNV